ILIRALDMLDSSVLDVKDRPAATIVAGALSIGWLQDGVDFLFTFIPAGGTKKTTVSANLITGTPTYLLPTDFASPFKDGLQLTDISEFLPSREGKEIASQPTQRTNWSRPKMYMIEYPFFTVRPVPDATYAYTLDYFALPTALGASDTPGLAIDLPLAEYVFLRGQEWHRVIPPNTAMNFLFTVADRLKNLGLTAAAQPKEAVPVGRPGKQPIGPAAPVQRS
ncbi:hypothetical protein LCGC14_3022780, partial [marine sediment metagenome]